ncbi:MAG: M55 family metallopeptidase [Bryobacterales bacterium]|nr:M55 family metallopeptidase [Bryobacterales bacterium]
MRRVLALLAFAVAAQSQGPRIFIVTDLEGVGGVNSWDEQVSPGQRRFEESRRLLVGEVNAAVEGALESGASEVIIWDGHDGSRTLSVDLIHPRAKLIQGRPTPPDYYLAEGRYDGIIFVGQHAKAGAPRGLLAHSQSLNVRDITINGRSVGEVGQVAAIAGHFGIPVIMLAGDQAACEEFLELQPKGETVAVKRLVGKASALSLSHAEACQAIRAAARRAVRRIREFVPWKIAGPVEMRFEFHPEKTATGEIRERPPRIYRGRTVLEAFEQWLGR